jgi:hypothetical protein
LSLAVYGVPPTGNELGNDLGSGPV